MNLRMLSPMVRWSPSLSVPCSTGRSLMRVRLVAPRSRTWQALPSRQTWQCCRDTLTWGMCRSASCERPITIGCSGTSMRLPRPSPWITTRHMVPCSGWSGPGLIMVLRVVLASSLRRFMATLWLAEA
ncbi:hypothetical protein B1808_07230 [Pseudofulvimonas gallinarii]|nr:hypothetical protein B1808_07230 [Pseudofulvimonas gallinarii]